MNARENILQSLHHHLREVQEIQDILLFTPLTFEASLLPSLKILDRESTITPHSNNTWKHELSIQITLFTTSDSTPLIPPILQAIKATEGIKTLNSISKEETQLEETYFLTTFDLTFIYTTPSWET